MTETLLIRPRDRAEFWTDERCFVTELVNDPAMPDASLARVRVEPGVTTALHRLDVDETYVIEAGGGMMEVGEARFPVSSGDSVRIAAGMPQRISNAGTADLVFLCLCRPRFRPEGYVDLEGSVAELQP